MEVVVVESKLWEELNQRLNSVEQLLISLNEKKDKKPTYHIDWIPLQKVYEILGINKHKWIRHYRKLFKTRKYKRETWIYKPDLEKWLMEHSFQPCT